MTASGAIDDPELAAWLAVRGWQAATAVALAGDVSERRYLRLRSGDGRRAIVALYPAALRPECARFEKSSALLSSVGVHVPRILGSDAAGRWMLVEDLGPCTVADPPPPSESALADTFAAAARVAARIATLPVAAVAELNPPLDAALLEREIDQTLTVYLEPAGLLVGSLRDRVRAALETLCSRLAMPRPAPAHRDFMVRNLVPMAGGGEPAVLDHQGLRLAPPLYDLASLLNDTLFPTPAIEARLLAEHAPSSRDRERYHRAAAQRTLKAVGTYAAFAARGHDRHLPLVRPTLARALVHLAELPEGRELSPELRRRWQGARRQA